MRNWPCRRRRRHPLIRKRSIASSPTGQFDGAGRRFDVGAGFFRAVFIHVLALAVFAVAHVLGPGRGRSPRCLGRRIVRALRALAFAAIGIGAYRERRGVGSAHALFASLLGLVEAECNDGGGVGQLEGGAGTA